jgi:transposase-like protein
VITLPLNDRECLGQVTEVVAELVRHRDATIAEIAQRFPSTAALASWIRTLPQRDDTGVPADGPKVEQCDPPQRLRIPADDPNCLERSALFLAAAEFIDPRPERRLATVNLPAGRHTMPVERGEPVILDPSTPRNAARGALFLLAPAKIALTPLQAVDWCARLAEEPASRVAGGVELVRNAHAVMRDALLGVVIPLDRVEAVALTLALAEREARSWGPQGAKVVKTTTQALDELDRRARNSTELRVGRIRIRPDARRLSALARVTARLGTAVGGAMARQYLAGLGLSDLLIADIESEMQREGLTLGPLAAQPRPIAGSLAALATKRAA